MSQFESQSDILTPALRQNGVWCIAKYARYIPVRKDEDSQTIQSSQAKPGAGSWKYFPTQNTNMRLVLSPTGHLMVTTDDTVHESINLCTSSQSTKVSPGPGPDTITVHQRNGGALRTFRVMFAARDGLSNQQQCSHCLLALRPYGLVVNKQQPATAAKPTATLPANKSASSQQHGQNTATTVAPSTQSQAQSQPQSQQQTQPSQHTQMILSQDTEIDRPSLVPTLSNLSTQSTQSSQEATQTAKHQFSSFQPRQPAPPPTAPQTVPILTHPLPPATAVRPPPAPTPMQPPTPAPFYLPPPPTSQRPSSFQAPKPTPVPAAPPTQTPAPMSSAPQHTARRACAGAAAVALGLAPRHPPSTAHEHLPVPPIELPPLERINISNFIRLCLLDSTFPDFVAAVETELGHIMSGLNEAS